jgi:hypothetical protein
MGRKRGHKRKGKIALLPLITAGYGPMAGLMDTYKLNDWAHLPDHLVYQSIGYDPGTNKFNTAVITRNAGLFIGGVIGHKLANKYINKYLRPWGFQL